MLRIKEMRKKVNVTQTTIASALNVTQACVALWEQHKAMPLADKLPKLAEILNCSIDELFIKETG